MAETDAKDYRVVPVDGWDKAKSPGTPHRYRGDQLHLQSGFLVSTPTKGWHESGN